MEQVKEVSEGIGDDIVLTKDGDGRVIGLEKLNFAAQPGTLRVQFETLADLRA
jgi:hypothetical protein